MSLRNNRVSIRTLQRAVESLKVNEHDDVNTDDPRNFDPNAGDKAIDANASKKVGEIEQAPVPPKSEQISRENADSDSLENTLGGQEPVDTVAVTQPEGAETQELPTDPGLATTPIDGAPSGEQGELEGGVSTAGEAATVSEDQYPEGAAAHADPAVTDAATQDPGVTAAIAEGEVAPTGEVAAMTSELATDPDAVVGDQAGSVTDTTVVVDTSSDDPVNADPAAVVTEETQVTEAPPVPPADPVDPLVADVPATEVPAEPAADPNAAPEVTEDPELSTESSEGEGRDPLDTDNKPGATEVGSTGSDPGIPEVAPANGNDPSGEVKDREPTPGDSGQDLSEQDIGVITDPTIDENLSVEALQAALLTLEESANELDYVNGRIEKIEKCQEMGGMEPEMAEEMQSSLESLSRRLNIPLKTMQKQMPSLENFSYGVSSRLRATQHSLESFKEFYEALKARLIKAIEWLSKFFNDNYVDLMQYFDRTGKRLASLKQTLAKAKFTTEGGTIESPTLARRLNIEGKIPTDFSETTNTVFVLALHLTNMSAPIRSGDFLRQVARTVQGGDQSRTPAEIIEGLTNINTVRPMRPSNEDGAIVYQSPVLFGNKQAYVSIPEGDWTTMDVNKLNAGVRELPTDGEIETVITLPNRTACKNIVIFLDGANEVAARLRKTAGEIKQMSSKTSTFLSRLGSNSNEGGDGEGDAAVDREKMGTVISAIQRLIRLAGEPLISYSRYVYVVSNDLISLVEAAIKQGGGTGSEEVPQEQAPQA